MTIFWSPEAFGAFTALGFRKDCIIFAQSESPALKPALTAALADFESALLGGIFLEVSLSEQNKNTLGRNSRIQRNWIRDSEIPKWVLVLTLTFLRSPVWRFLPVLGNSYASKTVIMEASEVWGKLKRCFCLCFTDRKRKRISLEGKDIEVALGLWTALQLAAKWRKKMTQVIYDESVAAC